MKTTKTAWTLLIAGTLFAGCQGNNSKPVAQSADTPSSVAYKDNGDDAAGMATSTPATIDNTTNTTTSPTTPVDNTSNACPTPVHKVRKAVAYNYHHRHYKKRVNKTTTETETTVAATEPETVTTTTTTTPTEPTFEKQSDYLGYTPSPVVTAPAKRPRVHLALEAGGNLNNLYKLEDDNQTSNQLKVGFNAGVMMNVEMGNRWGFEPGVRYIMKGAQITSTTSDVVTTTEHKEKLTFHYVEVPVNFVYNTGDWGTSHFMIGAGPYVSYLANAQDKTKDKATGPDGTVITTGQHMMTTGNPDVAGKVRNYDAGANAFIGYQMKGGMYIKGGAEVGLVDLQKSSSAAGGFKDRNYNFLLSIGYMCGYNKK